MVAALPGRALCYDSAVARPSRVSLRLLQKVDAAYEIFLAHRTRRVLGEADLHPFPYIGYGSEDRVRCLGRILRVLPSPWRGGWPRWRNALAMGQRLLSPAAPGVRVTVRLDSAEGRATTDEAGRYDLYLPADKAVPREGYYRLEVAVPGRGRDVVQEGLAVAPTPRSRFGVISDIDDTVLESGVARTARMWWKTLVHGPYRRKAFPGVAAFYRALQAGRSGRDDNPFFYVSGSSWDVYDLLVEFLRHRGLPLGHLRLKDVRRGFGPEPRGRQREYKERHMRAILDFLPDLPFLLLGDATEADPEIYTDLVRAYPGRILAIYIRLHQPAGASRRALEELGEEAASHGVDLVPASTTAEAARHALDRAWLRPDAIEGTDADPGGGVSGG